MNFAQRRWRAPGAAGVWAVLLLAAAMAVAAPAGGNEARALEEAKQSFAQGFWKQADAQFAGFARNYPESARLPEVVLWQAQARVRLGQHAEAVELLEKHLVRAGPLENEYRFWRAEAEMQRGNPAAAAKAWGELLRLFPNFRDALQAAYKEAFAHFELGELERAGQLLQAPEGHFHRLSAARTNDHWTVRGRLLHAEIALARNDASGAGAILAQLPATELTPEQQWQRKYLEARVLLAQDKPAEALAQATNLVATAPPAQPLAQAQSVALQAEVFERLGQIEAAVRAYTNNLARAVPPEFRQQALLRLVALLEAQNRTDSAISHLEAHAGDAEVLLDLYRLTLGELRLKKYYQLGTDSAPAAGDHAAVRSNLLEQAYADFIHATNSVRGAWAGRAELGRGWCLWEQRKLVESAQAFAAAAEKLPPSPEQAMARFKLGDARFGLEQFEAAVESYEAILREYRDRQTTDSLFDQALYQIVNSSVAAGNLEAASRALRRILEWFPETFFAEQTTMWVGQGFRRLQQPAEARGYFEKFTARFPESPLRADAALAIAQTYAQETNWMAASAELDRWVGQFTNHAKLPDAEFERAWVYYQAGRETNTFQMYTNFLARFPTNELAPRAMKWIGDYYRRAGDLKGAEESYQILYQNTNWPPSLLTYQARLLAGGTALMRQGFAEAREYFNWIINSGPPIVPNSPIPPEVVAEAYFALGSAILNGPSPGATNVIEQYQQAVNAFSKIPRLFPSDRLVPQALARLGFLHLQLARQFPDSYGEAEQFFREVIAHPSADPDTRVEAKMGLGLLWEKLADEKKGSERTELLERALGEFLEIFNRVYTAENVSERPAPHWISKAGLEAARLAEEALQLLAQAANVYQRLIDEFPVLKPRLEPKLTALAGRIPPE